ncbi:MAG: diaminopimelate epimerase [Chloroflexi bacterium]|nr:diaminopimelate epimerase [Chloroflexota bacterium]MCL5074923.1 diaminopimelate epimerase [Chloroflexota bacterium]
MHGVGNDFILVDAQGEPNLDWKDLAVKVCDRHFGVGADGLIALDTSKSADFRMRIFNPDGSEAEMCGNGIRCLARYVYDRDWTEKGRLIIDTLAGPKDIFLNIEHGEVRGITVDMGRPVFEPSRIPVNLEETIIKDYPLEVAGKAYRITCLSMGNPHAVIFFPKQGEVERLAVEQIGPLLEKHPLFPQRTNVEFCAVLDRRTIRMRVWERGVGETLACGSGACASTVAAQIHGLVDPEVTLILNGGNLGVRWSGRDEPVYMTGEAKYICLGEYFYEPGD